MDSGEIQKVDVRRLCKEQIKSGGVVIGTPWEDRFAEQATTGSTVGTVVLRIGRRVTEAMFRYGDRPQMCHSRWMLESMAGIYRVNRVGFLDELRGDLNDGEGRGAHGLAHE